MNSIKNLNEVSTRVRNWLEQCSADLPDGRFRFCLDGSLVDPYHNQATFCTCFAVKTALQTGIWQSWPEIRRRETLRFIALFQQSDGLFHDPFLARPAGNGWKAYVAALLGRRSWPISIDRQVLLNLRADTRQEALTLVSAGEKPPFPLNCELTDPPSADRFFDSLDWSIPWSAGSHLSHQVVFLALNAKLFGIDHDYREILAQIMKRLAEIRHPEDGCWYRGEVAPDMKINGAMKIFAMLCWLDEPQPECDKLLTFALSRPFLNDGCGFLNRLWVVYNAYRASSPGAAEEAKLTEVIQHAVISSDQFLQRDGGYSFRHEGAQPYYYGCRVSNGTPVGDIQGTYMQTWALSLCNALRPELFTGGEKWRIVKP